MTVRFTPPQLQVARHSATLCRLADEVCSSTLPAEMRVLQQFPQNELRLILISEGRQPASIKLPRNWLYAQLTEDEIRERLQALLSEKVPSE
jgi:hypothetical protein